jgi:hypothetical protein
MTTREAKAKAIATANCHSNGKLQLHSNGSGNKKRFGCVMA